MGLKFSGCAINYEALVPRSNEPSVLSLAQCRLADVVWLSPLLAYTLTPDRCKSFISTHIANDPPGLGVRVFVKLSLKAMETRRLARGCRKSVTVRTKSGEVVAILSMLRRAIA